METKIPIRDIMTRRVVTADPDTNVADISRKMLKENVGCIIVVEDNQPIGIITERDIVRKLVSKDLNPTATTIKELMAEPIITVPHDMSLLDVTKKMAQMNIRRFPVVKNGKMVGIVSETDIVSVSSDLDRIRAELIEMSRGRIMTPQGDRLPEQGVCEKCGELSERLEVVDGVALCEVCRYEFRR